MADSTQTAEQALRKLRAEFHAQGLHRAPTGRVLAELVVHVTLAMGGIALFVLGEQVMMQVFGLLVSTAGSMGVGSNSHSASHNASSHSRHINQLLTYFGSPFFFGVSASFWWRKHIGGHHRTPNGVDHDPDLDLAPWFVLHESAVQSSVPFLRWYYRHMQWLVFPVALCFNHLNMQRQGLQHLYEQWIARRWRLVHSLDLLALLLHLVLFVAVPLLFLPAADVLLFTLLRWAAFGYAMFIVLAPAHWPAEAAFTQAGSGQSSVALQVHATVNFRAGLLGRFFCSGLDYQIEHHLFPEISHVYYPRMAPQVTKFCHEQGLPYRRLGWGEALIKSLRVLRDPKPVLPTVLSGTDRGINA